MSPPPLTTRRPGPLVLALRATPYGNTAARPHQPRHSPHPSPRLQRPTQVSSGEAAVNPAIAQLNRSRARPAQAGGRASAFASVHRLRLVHSANLNVRPAAQGALRQNDSVADSAAPIAGSRPRRSPLSTAPALPRRKGRATRALAVPIAQPLTRLAVCDCRWAGATSLRKFAAYKQLLQYNRARLPHQDMFRARGKPRPPECSALPGHRAARGGTVLTCEAGHYPSPKRPIA